MKFWTLAAAVALAVPSAALACSCMYTEDPVELRALAKDSVPNAVALVEAETILTFQESNGAGDRMRVTKLLAGSASGEFRVQRGNLPSSASCDQLYDKGQRAIMILYPASPTASGEASYRISGLCTAGLLAQPAFRDEVERLIGRRSAPERG